MSERVPVTRCAGCDAPCDAATVADSTHPLPVEGDLSICAYCGAVGIYRADQTIRPITPQEWARMDPGQRRQIEGASQFAAARRKGGTR